MTKSATPKVSPSTIGEVVGLLISAGFLVSVTYDWGYLRSFGLSFSDLPTTLSDHLRTGLVWFPPLLSLLILYFGLEFQIQRVERGLTEEEIVAASKGPEKTKKRRQLPYRFIGWVCAFAVFSYLLIGELSASVPAAAFAIVWFMFANWCYDTPLIQLRRNKVVQLAFFLLPAILMVAYFSGRSDAASASYRSPEPVSIQLAGGNTELHTTYLRSFDHGLLVLSAGKNVKFVVWSDIRSYEFSQGYLPHRGLLCVFGVLCPASP